MAVPSVVPEVVPDWPAIFERVMASDIEPAFGDLREDRRFVGHAGELRASLDSALASPPATCASLGAVLEDVGGNCKACHQDFRN
mgnify:CR=1 FL=1